MDGKYRVSESDRAGLAVLIAALPAGPLLGLELGSALGESALMFMESGKFLRLACVDLFRNEAAFDARLGRYEGLVDKYRGTTAECAAAVRKFSGAMFDFLYIDANHEYEHVLEDLQLYRPLVVSPGIVAGHDWSVKRPGVEKAVREYFGASLGEVVRFQDTSWMVKV